MKWRSPNKITSPTMMQDDEVLIDAQEGLEQDFEDDDDAMDDEDPTPSFPRLAPSLLEVGRLAPSSSITIPHSPFPGRQTGDPTDSCPSSSIHSLAQ